MQPTLNDLILLARQAGEILRQGYGNTHQVAYKGVINPVTEVDQQSEAFLLEAIQRRFPGHHIVAEENGEVQGDADSLWYIDPIDGTVNFAHGVPIFSVSLAYVREGAVQFGVVYAPLLDECFAAARGQGATLNGQPIRVSPTDTLDGSLLVTGFPYHIRTTTENNLNWYAHFALRTQGVRRLGSAALDLCYVAAGRFDGYWEKFVEPWDVAAGALIAREAGAVVTAYDGTPDIFRRPCSVVAANPLIHAAMLQEFRENGLQG
ncbi:MAG: inositol monophosphatase [Anaerolineae bacterium]|nr:MAG: inositol monophosphatase [Anaerolineae bacterium]